MGDTTTFEKICRAMSDPSFYRHPVLEIERRDSHISAVFLTGDRVYKLKKPFNFGFLDYTDLETRKTMCEREVTLNRRLSNGVYEGVAEIRRDGEKFHLGAKGGEVVEYAVCMKQLPDTAALSHLLGTGRVDQGEMVRLGRQLGGFCSLSERNPEISRYGRADVISYNTEENFRQLIPFEGTLIEKDSLEVVRESSRGFFRDCRHLFDRRVEEKRICDGHGDLRAEHVYLVNGIQIIDCIEFNDRFRYCDTASDLAFLHMDMDRLGRPDLSLCVLDGYIEQSGDFGVYTVLDFYSCYRAIVKLKVSCLTWAELEEGSRRNEMEERASQYLGLALRYAVQFSRPSIWVFCGLPGSGKSTLAEKVKDTFAIPIYRSDLIRTTLPEYGSHSGPVPLDTGIYTRNLRGRVYAHLLSAAQEDLKKGRSVVLDATFSERKWRNETVRLARDHDANIFFLECMCSEQTMLGRLGRRKAGAEKSLSDARPEHLTGLRSEYEKIEEFTPEFHAVIDTEQRGPNEIMREVVSKTYAMKRTQVERVVESL